MTGNISPESSARYRELLSDAIPRHPLFIKESPDEYEPSVSADLFSGQDDPEIYLLAQRFDNTDSKK